MSVEVEERVGVVVVHFGDPPLTMSCLEALRRDTSPWKRELVVVDNSGNLPHDLAGVTALQCPDNPGFGVGANRGVAALGPGPWSALVVLNNDIEVASGFLSAAVRAVVQPGVAAAGGPLYLDRLGGDPWYAGGGINFLTGTVWQCKSHRAATDERFVGFIPGAAIAVSQVAWGEIGGFDPAYFLFNEDLDLCLRLRRRGYRLLFTPGMAAVHRLGGATGSAGRSSLYLEHLTATRLRPFRPFAYRAYLAFLHSGYVALRAARHFLTGAAAGRAAARALLAGHRRALAGLLCGPR